MSNKYQIVNKLIPRTTVDFYRQLKKLFNDKNPMTHELVDAILSVFLLLTLRHCIEGMSITLMINCPAAVSKKCQIESELISRTTIDFNWQLKKLFNDKNPTIHVLVGAILSIFLLLTL